MSTGVRNPFEDAGFIPKKKLEDQMEQPTPPLEVASGASVVEDRPRRKRKPKPPVAPRTCRLQTNVSQRVDDLLFAAVAERRTRGMRGRALDIAACLEEAIEKTFGHLVPIQTAE